MNRKRTSIIWKVPQDEFANIVKNASSITAIARAIGACPEAGTFPIIKKRLREDGIDYSHIKLGLNSNSGRSIPRKSLPLEAVMVENSTYSRTHLKRRLLVLGRLKNECGICGLGPVWNGKPISMRLDHKNGISNDHRFCNLRMVCPNCDSQLDTFCIGNRGKRERWRCEECKRPVSKNSVRCRDCNHKSRISNMPTKIEWPSDSNLSEMLRFSSKNAVSKKLGISWQALDKRLKTHQIELCS